MEKATDYPWESDDSERGEEPDDAAEERETDYPWDSDDSERDEEPYDESESDAAPEERETD